MKKFYKIEVDKINNVVGKIASVSMDPEYNYNSEFSIYNLKSSGQLHFQPDFKSIQIQPRAKVLDIINSIPVGDSGLLISNNLLNILQKFKLPKETQIFNAYLSFKNTMVPYNYFYIYKSLHEEIIDYKQTNFYSTNSIGEIKDKLNLESLEDWLKAQNDSNIRYIHADNVTLTRDAQHNDIFRLSHIARGYYISEKIKIAIETSAIRGICFSDNISIRV